MAEPAKSMREAVAKASTFLKEVGYDMTKYTLTSIECKNDVWEVKYRDSFSSLFPLPPFGLEIMVKVNVRTGEIVGFTTTRPLK